MALYLGIHGGKAFPIGSRQGSCSQTLADRIAHIHLVAAPYQGLPYAVKKDFPTIG
ncbi:hypothetical protein [Hymenobacter saemangeumensis]|uniref:hypothetical protein n=1 Tax=Hymenobacter saemangeumensis TaxID=1084522 RepID=UPI0031E9D2F4